MFKFNNQNLQNVGEDALQSVTNLLGQGFPSATNYAQQQQTIQQNTQNALAYLNNLLNTGVGYSQVYLNNALTGMNNSYAHAYEDITPAKQAQTSAIQQYMSQLGLTSPNTSSTPETYQKG